jgi:hypothetical protein
MGKVTGQTSSKAAEGKAIGAKGMTRVVKRKSRPRAIGARKSPASAMRTRSRMREVVTAGGLISGEA